ncbi:MAG: CBS domain-containing protein [Planctomycetota bacterium]|nr:MAG: CBS domain-containing protein [Planctomycetota bacterium]
MKWSLQVARLAGIPIRVHASFLLLLAWVAYAHYRRDPDLRGVGLAVLFLCLVFAVVVLHELSHALTARAYGIRTREITLWPIGGISHLERMPEQPAQEFWIAVAGPLLNVALALLLGALVVATRGAEGLVVADFEHDLLASLVWVNAALAVFNLLPAFPMDGGRILRALLSMALGRVAATQVAAGVGRAMAILFALIGLAVNPFLLLIALFVWLGGSAEVSHAELRAALSGHPVAHAMTRALATLPADAPLGQAARLLVHRGQRIVPLLGPAGLEGVLCERDLLRGLARGGLEAPAKQFARRRLPAVSPRTPLLEAFELLGRRRAPCLLVEEEGRLLGVLTREGIGHFVSVLSALRGEPPPLELGNQDALGGGHEGFGPSPASAEGAGPDRRAPPVTRL